MEDLSLHILDIAENSVAAKADRIEIQIAIDKKNDLLSLEIIDNGTGMDKDTIKRPSILFTRPKRSAASD